MLLHYLLTKLDKYDVGHTGNIDKRIKEHLSGISAFTSKAQDWELKYKEAFETFSTHLRNNNVSLAIIKGAIVHKEK